MNQLWAINQRSWKLSKSIWDLFNYKPLAFEPMDFESLYFEPINFESLNFEPINIKTSALHNNVIWWLKMDLKVQRHTMPSVVATWISMCCVFTSFLRQTPMLLHMNQLKHQSTSSRKNGKNYFQEILRRERDGYGSWFQHSMQGRVCRIEWNSYGS